MQQDSGTHRIPEEQARRILARAIEIDSAPAALTIEELRSIASEVGISTAALEAALTDDVRNMDRMGADTARPFAWLCVAVGPFLGITAGALLSTYSPVAELVAWSLTNVGGLMLGATLFMLDAKRPSLAGFNLKNLTLWLGIGAGGAAAVVFSGAGLYSFAAVAAIRWSLEAFVASTLFGSVGVSIVRTREDKPEAPNSCPVRDVVPGAPSIAERLRRWLLLRQRDTATAPVVLHGREAA